MEGDLKLRLKSPEVLTPEYTIMWRFKIVDFKTWRLKKNFATIKVFRKLHLGQGTNTRKVISEVYAFFVLQLLSLGGKVNIRLINFHKNNLKKCFYLSRILDEHWCIYSCLPISPRENWFQYARRVYATAISFPCISTLIWDKFSSLNF